MTNRLGLPISLAFAVAAAGCNQGNNDTGHNETMDMATAVTRPMDAAQPAADLTTFAEIAEPQVQSAGGPVLTTPKVQPIFYQADPNQTELETFLKTLATSVYWTSVAAEYGVGSLTVLPTIVIASAAPTNISDKTIRQMITTNTTGADPAWGAADTSIIYLLLTPVGTVVESGGASCQDYDGYHDSVEVSGKQLSYASCSACPGFDGPQINALAQRTVVIGHELIEAATDPFPNATEAFGYEDDADFVWTMVTGGEVADMCTFQDDWAVTLDSSAYTVQRSWSNAAAQKGLNPCLPAPASPFILAQPILPDMLSIQTGQFTSISTPGLQMAVGDSKTIDIALHSSAPTGGTWLVHPYDYDGDFLGASKPNLTLKLDTEEGNDGDILHLTITVNSFDQNLGGAAFILDSIYNGESSLTMGFVAAM